jgi:hypothetical protein
MDSVKIPPKEWDPQALIEDLKFELAFDANNAASATARLLRETATPAAQSISHLAMYAGNEKVRLDAAKFIVDRTLQQALDHDLKMQQAQITLVGQVISTVIRSLGLRYGFDPDSPEVKQIAYEKILELAAVSGEEEHPG